MNDDIKKPLNHAPTDGGTSENDSENSALSPSLMALAEGLLKLTDEERQQLEAAITPEISLLLGKVFGEEFFELLSPFMLDDNPEDVKRAENELRQLMRDPRYWRDKDSEIIRKVSDGFRRLYPEQQGHPV